jgi:processive 1,2-diacylglycerol beta-glucosyltransferase
MLLLDVVPGHGRGNLQHELELGDAGVTSPRAASVVRNALAAAERARSPRGQPVPAAVAGHWEAAFCTALAGLGF